MRRELRAVLALAFLAASPCTAQPLTLLDVPFIAQSELLCGGAAAAMVLRYWGERGIDADAFAPLVDRRAGGIRTDALSAALRERRWNATEIDGSAELLMQELHQGRPVIALIEDRPAAYHFVVVVARNADGVVFHDPARAPFRVASVTEFDKRWSAARRWMLIVTPRRSSGQAPPMPRAAPSDRAARVEGTATGCDALIAAGVGQAQRNDLDGAERTLASAIACPGGAAFRELAGVRAVQRRWPEAADLATAAISRDPSDDYAYRLLATANFVTNDKPAALDAWNHVGEPRIDLIRIDGLARTRQPVVTHVVGLKTGETLTRESLLRARRRLAELPAGYGVVDFAPLPSGLAEVRAAVAERPLFPLAPFDLAVLGLATVVTREVAASISSPTGGGEQITLDWRFWAHRPLYQLSIAAPAPWRGVWRLAASRERQPFNSSFAPVVHDSLQLDATDWLTGSMRWQVGGGIDRWNSTGTFPNLAGGVRLLSAGDRLDLRAQARAWIGEASRFGRGELRMTARSSASMQGTVLVIDGGLAAISASAPADLWVAGDTGRARPLPLRAHPILGGDERFRTERMGRLFSYQSSELQRWWRVGPFRAGAATFVDLGQTAHRLLGPALFDADVGAGVRGAYPGRAGALRLDFAHGLRDGDNAVSMIYTAAIP